MSVRTSLLLVLAVIVAIFLIVWGREIARRGFKPPRALELAIGFVTNFFDTLGIGSFAPTTSAFKLWKLSPDERIPGTLNVGHTLPTVAEAIIFIALVPVAPLTLTSLIAAAVLGSWLGAGIVARWPRRYVQIGMGIALLAAGAIFIGKFSGRLPSSGQSYELHGTLLIAGIVGNFILGALMTLGIGLYAPAMIMVSLLGMSPLAAFPIMMGSCAFLMPVCSWRFIRFDAYTLPAALGLAIGGVPGVLLAAYVVKSLPLHWLFVLVAIVVFYTAFMMLRSAAVERRVPPVPEGAGVATP
ncbi:MAG TPA: sulfite exporter TauE/SafE family protein [Candidatus Baltobacteraceae bacterium]|jgi:uncharacterized membrane protein YfcA|nr:sulfite exporter TauE/SafE family protein [Candidatus Baltobacteraceae bacterium]